MYTRILLPLDGSDVSEQALPYAQSLAVGLSLPVTLLYAIDAEAVTIPQSLNPSLHIHETADHRLREADGYMQSVRRRLEESGLDARVETPQGEPAEAIVAAAGRESGTLITMSSHGRSGLARWWTGSVTDKVLHLTDNPLLVVHAGSQHRTAPESAFQRITVPVDGSELAEEILPHAVYLSSALGLTIDLIRVNPSPFVDLSGYRYAHDEYALTVIRDGEDRLNQLVEGYLAELKERLEREGAAAVETHLRHGSPADHIADLAAATPNNLVAMTTHGRSGVGRLVLGSVAERVARQSGDPVLLVRGGPSSATG